MQHRLRRGGRAVRANANDMGVAPTPLHVFALLSVCRGRAEVCACTAAAGAADGELLLLRAQKGLADFRFSPENCHRSMFTVCSPRA